jgi:hypothetical protein
MRSSSICARAGRRSSGCIRSSRPRIDRGAAVTYAIGVKIGEKGLTRFVSERRLDRLRARVKEIGAITLGITAAMPPPFPLTAFVLTSGALEVGRNAILHGVRRRAADSLRRGRRTRAALWHGGAAMLDSPTAHAIAIGLVVISILGHGAHDRPGVA